MNNVFDLPVAVCNSLKENLGFENVSFITKYPNIIKSMPLKKTVVCLSIKDVNFIDSGIGCGTEKLADVTLEVLVCVPLNNRAVNCSDIMKNILEHLWESQEFSLKECNICEVTASKETGAYQLKGSVKTTIKVEKAVQPNE